MRLVLLLLLLWLVLNESLAPGHLLLGGLLALAAAAGYWRLRAGHEASRARHPLTALRLAFTVFADIVASNVAVGRIVLGLRREPRTAGFLPIPLAIRHPGGLAVLACIVTATPGTSWVRYDREQGLLTLHVLDLREVEAAAALFKQRYEKPLMEIFE
jgi:multicomponent K+:H+ antiporter subunit E